MPKCEIITQNIIITVLICSLLDIFVNVYLGHLLFSGLLWLQIYLISKVHWNLQNYNHGLMYNQYSAGRKYSYAIKICIW